MPTPLTVSEPLNRTDKPTTNTSILSSIRLSILTRKTRYVYIILSKYASTYKIS